MPDIARPIAIHAENASPRGLPDGFPAQLTPRMAGRTRRPVGDPFGLTVFGVNLTRLAPGAWSTAHHKHNRARPHVTVTQHSCKQPPRRGRSPSEP